MNTISDQKIMAPYLQAARIHKKHIGATNRAIINFHCNGAEIINERPTYSTMNDEKSL